MAFEIVVDARSPYHLAHFWAEALPGYDVRAYDAAEVDRLAALGLTPETDTSVRIDSNTGPTVWFQLSETLTLARNRIHFDLAFGPREPEAARLVALGASIRDEHSDHTVMLDPEGNQFCLFDPKTGS